MLVLASVVHVGTLVAVGRRGAQGGAAAATDPVMALVAIESPLDPEPERATTPVEARDDAPARVAPSAQTRTSSARPSAVAAGASSGTLITEGPASPEPGAWTLRVVSGPAGGSAAEAGLARLGLEGQNRFMGARETPEAAERAAQQRANREAGEAMRGVLHAHDVALGLGGGGPVVSAIEGALRESLAPDESRGVFVAFADASGAVTRVEVESASDSPAFQTVAADVLHRLRGQKVRVPSGASGLAMRIQVNSSVSLPSGGGPGLDLASAGAHFDVSDLGARPRRVIHARVLAEQLL